MSTIPVNIDNFARAESDVMFARLAADAGGIGAWKHYREPTPLDHQLIVRSNRDTLYSAAIVDLTEPVTVTLPEAGGRYMSLMVVNQDHYLPRILHGAGEYTLTREELGTQHVLLAVRTFVDPADPADVAEVNRLQDAISVETTVNTPFELLPYDEVSQAATRDALLRLAEGLPDFVGGFGAADEVRPVRHIVGTAAGWGGLPESEANYVNVAPGLPVGEYSLRIVDPPVDAFWSISLYNADGFFVPNDLGVTSINSVTGVPDADGAITIRLGDQPDGSANYLPIMEGWNFLFRMYQPRPEAFDGSWSLPAIEVVER